MRSIRAITCRADLDTSAPEIGQAREYAEAGDLSWQQWIDEYDSGRAFVLQLVVTIAFDEGEDEVNEISALNRGVWVEASQHPPVIARQVQDVAAKDFNHLSAQLRGHGMDVTAAQLAEMHTRIELSPELLRALAETRSGARGLLPEVESSGG